MEQLPKRNIRFCYRKIVDHTSAGVWEKDLLHDTFGEFRMQSQLYNPSKQHLMFSEIATKQETVNHLNYLTGVAAIPYLKALKEMIPDIRNNNGESFMKFTQYRFQILESNRSNITQHSIAIDFYSDNWHWLATIGEQILITSWDEIVSGPVLTHQLKLQPFFSIYSIQYADYNHDIAGYQENLYTIKPGDQRE